MRLRNVLGPSYAYLNVWGLDSKTYAEKMVIVALSQWRDGVCSFVDSWFCFLCQCLELAIKEGQRQVVPESQTRQRRRLGCLISAPPVLTSRAHKHHSRATWSHPFQVFLDPFQCQYDFGFISIPKCERVIKMQIANSRQLKCNFLTPSAFASWISKRFRTTRFFSSCNVIHTDTGSKTGPSDERLQWAGIPSQSRDSSRPALVEPRRSSLQAIILWGCDLCNTISFETRSKSSERVLGRFNGSILYSLLQR